MKSVLYSIIIAFIVMFLGASIFWGLGNLVIWVFRIDYTWTILHGLVAEFFYVVLKEIFKGGN